MRLLKDLFITLAQEYCVKPREHELQATSLKVVLLLWILFLDPLVCDAFHYNCWLNVYILVHVHSGEAAVGCTADLYHTFQHIFVI